MAATDRTSALVDSAKRSRRLADILDLVATQGSVSIDDLTTALDTSAATIRRDLAVLAERRLVLRTHGGASAVESAAEMPVALRDMRRRDAKRLIAQAAAELIPHERQAIVLSGGTTTAELVRVLAARRGLTIVTNSLSIASLVTAYPNLKVVVTGGQLRSQSLEMVGMLAERALASMNVAIAVLGADGVAADGGITTYDEIEARTNSMMLSRARRRIVLADGSKIGAAALARMAELTDIQTLVTDSHADPAELARIREAGVDVVVVQAPTE